MPAIHQGTSVDVSSIKFRKTRVKVVVHSHVESAQGNSYVFTNDVIAFSTSKTTSGPGTCDITFMPRANILNVVFPNDYVNIYVDRGDGDGFTRVFFGFVDRIAEELKIGQDGKPESTVSVACTDFSKLVDKTNIYFNPHLIKRKEFDGTFLGSAGTIGGSALRSAGIIVVGSPPDIIIQTMIVLLGGAGQFVLPPGYSSRVQSKFRRQRAEFALKRLVRNFSDALPAGDIERVSNLLKKGLVEESTSSPLDRDDLESVDVLSVQEANKLREAVLSVQDIVTKLERTNRDEKGQIAAALSSATTTAPSFLDILDLFTFVEREAIDGYSQDSTVWNKTGSVLKFISSMQNDIVNEMFFDLRAVSKDDSSGLIAGDQFSREPDEISHNEDETAYQNGIQYVPALVMREYPFSTINFLDGRNAKFKLTDKDYTLGIIQFGAIFSDQPNEPGRHVIELNNINIDDKLYGASTSTARKHLDVAVLNDTDVVSYSLGRSDHEHFNLLEINSDGLLGTAITFFLDDVIPIITPIHIARHGLRVNGTSTAFAHYGEITDAKTNLDPPPSDELKGTDDTTTEEPEWTGAAYHPLTVSPTRISSIGYRLHNAGENFWTYHYGADLYAPYGSEVVAPVDGHVVAVMPAGAFNLYGNTVVIKARQQNNGKDLFIFLAHLSSFEPTLLQATNPAPYTSKYATRIKGASKDFIAGGRLTPYPITAGTTVGYLGTTAGTENNPNATFTSSEPHLHVETIYRYAPSTYIGFPKVPFSESSGPPSAPPASPPLNDRMVDPEVYFSGLGVDLRSGAVSSSPEEEHPDDQPDEDLETGAPPPDTREEVAPAESSKNTAQNGADNRSTRVQLARWCFLLDHWFQHNLEYLSGQIVTPGSPDIRVGYRLDLVDRNMSFYVEGVSHTWQFPNAMSTTLSVTRGQPNNPFPVYVPPALKIFDERLNQRRIGSRLGEYFIYPNSEATERGLSIRLDDNKVLDELQTSGNITDTRLQDGDEWTIPASTSTDAVTEQETLTPEEARSILELFDEDAEDAISSGSSAYSQGVGREKD